jgi:hypothetical protein
MVWDLRGALLKKQEVETARLAEFDFRLRARTMRLLAARVGGEPEALVRAIAEQSDEAIVAGLAMEAPDAPRLYDECRSEARRQLIEELGDPSPHRLA